VKQWMEEDKLARVRKLTDFAGELGTAVSTLAVAWAIKNPNVTTAILGATKKEQLTQNLKALDVLPKLTTEVMQQIDDIMGTKPTLPEY
jgi:aryl-alcohol dehydrogenase-like predicted oxidoreductase